MQKQTPYSGPVWKPGDRCLMIRSRHGWFEPAVEVEVVSHWCKHRYEVIDDDGNRHEIRHSRDLKPIR
jgi:hypothetical protein